MRRRNRPAVQSVTAARSGLSEDVTARTRRYLISMGIRTACLLGAVVADGVLRWALVAGAVLLPYFAVIAANAGRERSPVRTPEAVLPYTDPALGAGPGSPPPAGDGDGGADGRR